MSSQLLIASVILFFSEFAHESSNKYLFLTTYVALHLNLSAPHDAPSDFSGVILNSTAVHLSWSPPRLPYGVITSYTITYNATQRVTHVVLIPGNKTTNYIIDNLNEDTNYTFTVYASTRIGAGPYAEWNGRSDEYCRLSSALLGSVSANSSEEVDCWNTL